MELLSKHAHRNTKRLNRPLKTLLCLPCLLAPTVQAADFGWGALKGSASGSVLAGAIWKTQSANPNSIYQGNADAIGYGSPNEFNPKGGRSNDDGRINYPDPGLASTPLIMKAQLQLDYRNLGVFLSGKAWYDYFQLHHNVAFGNSSDGYRQNTLLDDGHFNRLSRFKGVTLTEAYAFGHFTARHKPLEIRIGNQILRWGESKFFIGGLDSISPYQPDNLRIPGESFRLPVPMISAKYALMNTVNLEAFYQLAWRKTVLEGCGTAFSNSDDIPDGCFGANAKGINDAVGFADRLYVARGPDRTPRNSGQYGVAAHFKVADLKTNLGLYAMNIHSRQPFYSVITDRYTTPGSGWRNPALAPENATDNAKYFIDYPEDIHIFGASFASRVGRATRLFGEYSYRPNQPIQLNTPDLVAAFDLNPRLLAAVLGENVSLGEDAIQAAPGSLYNGYDRHKVSQLTMGLIQPIPKVLGARALVIAGEAGVNYIHDLPSLDARRYRKPNIYGTDLANGSTKGCKIGSDTRYHQYACSTDGYVSRFSWGYRLKAQLNYPDVIANISVKPYLIFGQDVKGWSYDANFVQGRLVGAVGIKASYGKRYDFNLLWAGSGNTPYTSTDRDFLTVTLGMKF